MIYSMDVNEALAVARLRQWATLRVANRQGRTRNPNSHGWQRRDERSFDAAQVCVIDFERAMNALTDEEKVALVMRYRDRERDEVTARALGCSVRKVGYLVPSARHKLADILDRLNLL
jgi:DNA-directed RNA polymerase specialized sigma24 family protein